MIFLTNKKKMLGSNDLIAEEREKNKKKKRD